MANSPTWLRMSAAYHTTKRERDKRSFYKDAITNPIIRSAELTKNSHVLFMPGMYGPEVDIVVKEKGIPKDHVWTIEYVEEVRKFQKAAGLQTTPTRMDFCDAIPFIHDHMGNPGFDLVYFDLQTLLTQNYIDAIGYLASKSMIRKGGMLVVSTGWSSYPISEAIKLDRKYHRLYPQWASHLPATMLILKDDFSKRPVFWRECDYDKYKNDSGIWHLVCYFTF